MTESPEVKKLITAAANAIYQEFRQDPEFALRVQRDPFVLRGWVGAGEGDSQIWLSFPVDIERLADGQAEAIAYDFVAALKDGRAAHKLKV